MRMHAGYRACSGTGFSAAARTAAPRSEVLIANVDGRFFPEPAEIFLDPGVGSLASHLHQVAQVAAVCVELIEGTQLGQGSSAAQSLRCRPSWLLRVAAPALSKLAPVVTKKCNGAGLTGGDAD